MSGSDGGRGPRGVDNEAALVAACVALGAAKVGGPLSSREVSLLRKANQLSRPNPKTLDQLVAEIRSGKDPLGAAFCRLRPPRARRSLGAFYTAEDIVSAMLGWVLGRDPDRIVDVGCGSGRFALIAQRLGFSGEVIAVDVDPIATLMTRANLAVAGYRHAKVVHGDFLRFSFQNARRHRTAFIGNPPYVRHHDLNPEAKRWAQSTGDALGIQVSGLAGLHALFVLAIARLSKPGDLGCLITAAEWLDVRYGSTLRELFSRHLGCVRLDLGDPKTATFGDAMSTALIVSWQVGYRGAVSVRKTRDVKTLRVLDGGRLIARDILARSARWRDVVSPDSRRRGLVPLGTYAAVHRGVATGSNNFFILARDEAIIRGLEHHVRPCVTRASQVILSGGVIRADKLDRVLLDIHQETKHGQALSAYLEEGVRHRVPERYLCAHRRPWWRLGGSPSPPIIATYMARQAPTFATNPDRCRIVNVLHGIHFREEVDDDTATALVTWLNSHRGSFTGGRTYHGGLQKFEPRELEAILVPPLHRLADRKPK